MYCKQQNAGTWVKAFSCVSTLSVLLVFSSPVYAQSISSPLPTALLQTTPLAKNEHFNTREGPLVADIDFDGVNDIIIGGTAGDGGALFAYQLTGTRLNTAVVGLGPQVSPVAIDSSDYLQIGITDGTKIHQLVWYVGSPVPTSLPGWPLVDPAFDTGMFSDLSGDGTKEFVYLSRFNHPTIPSAGLVSSILHVRGRSAVESPGWPVDILVREKFYAVGRSSDFVGYQPLYYGAGDIDGDGRANLAFSGTYFTPPSVPYNADGVLTLKHDGSGVRTRTESSGDIDYLRGSPVVLQYGATQKIVAAFDEDSGGDSDVFNAGGIALLTPSGTSFTASYRKILDEEAETAFPPVVGNLLRTTVEPEVVYIDDGFLSADDAYLVEPTNRIHAYSTGTSGEVDGFPINLPFDAPAVSGTASVVDLDGDNNPEIVVPTGGGVLAWRNNGERYVIANGQQSPFNFTQGDGNNVYKVKRITNPIAGAANTAVWFEKLAVQENYDFVYIYSGNVTLPPEGTGGAEAFDNYKDLNPPLQTFTATYSGWSVSVPGNSIQVVLVTDEETNFFGYKISKVLSGTTQSFTDLVSAVTATPGSWNVGVEGAPWFGDANRDGLLDMAFVCNDGEPNYQESIRIISLNTPYRPENVEWGMYRHDPERTNSYKTPTPRPANTPPQLQPIGSRLAIEGELLQFTLRATDLDSQPLTYSYQGTLPPGANFNAQTRVLSITAPVGTVTPGETRPYPSVRFIVSDGSATDYEDVVFSIRQTAFVAVTTPAGGETLVTGTTRNVSWNYSGVPQFFDVTLYSASDTYFATPTVIPVANSFSFVIPTTIRMLSPSEWAAISVCGYFGSDGWKCDLSNNLTLQPAVWVSRPDKTDVVFQAEPFSVNWSTVGINGPVSLALYRSDDFVQQLASGVANSGTYSYFPVRINNRSSGYQIQVSGVNGEGRVVSGFSEKFSILTGSNPQPFLDLVVLTPPAINSGTLQAGGSVTLNAEVKNLGNSPTGSFSSRFRVDLNSSTFTTADITLSPNPSTPPLGADQIAQILSGPWNSLTGGTHTVEVCVDQPGAVVSEINELNNCATSTFYIAGDADFTLSGTSSITLQAGSFAVNSINITRVGPANPLPVTITAISGLPTGATDNRGINTLTCTPTCSSTVVINSLGSTPVGTYPITVTAQSSALSHTFNFNLVVTAPPDQRSFLQDSSTQRIVSIEAEHFQQNHAVLLGQPTSGAPIIAVRNWAPDNFTGASGGAGMAVLPNLGFDWYGCNSDSGVFMSFKVTFTKTGNHYLWLRGRAPGSGSRFIDIGLDGATQSASQYAEFPYTDANWIWTKKGLTVSRLKLNIPTLGLHTVNVCLNADGTGLDKLVLTSSGSYTLSGNGPTESARTTP